MLSEEKLSPILISVGTPQISQASFTAFKYGVPPHGGMAPGIDRILMLINDEPNLREVQAFPASASGADNMMGSPSVLDDEQLEELGIEIVKED